MPPDWEVKWFISVVSVSSVVNFHFEAHAARER